MNSRLRKNKAYEEAETELHGFRPIEDYNPADIKKYNEQLSELEREMLELDAYETLEKQRGPTILSETYGEVKAVYKNAKKRWGQFEEAYPKLATGVKILGVVTFGTLFALAGASLAHELSEKPEHKDSKDVYTLDKNVNKVEGKSLETRASADPDYNINDISNDPGYDNHPKIDETGVYWLKGNNPYSIMFKDVDADKTETLAEKVSINYELYDVDGGDVVFVKSSAGICVLNKDTKEMKTVVPTPSDGVIRDLHISNGKITYYVDYGNDTASIFLVDKDGTNQKSLTNGFVGLSDFKENLAVYIKSATYSGENEGYIINVDTNELTKINNFNNIRVININKDGKLAFIATEDGTNWAAYLQENYKDSSTVTKIKDVSSKSAQIALGSKKCVIDETDGTCAIFDLATKTSIDFTKQKAIEFDTFDKDIVYETATETASNEIYITDLTIKEVPPPPVEQAPIFTKLPEGQKVSKDKPLEIVVSDPEGKSVTTEVLTPGFKFDGTHLDYVGNVPEKDTLANIHVRASDGTLSTDAYFNATIEGKGVTPQPDPVQHNNNTDSGFPLWGKIVIPSAIVTALAAIGIPLGVVAHKKNKGKQNGKKGTAYYPAPAQPMPNSQYVPYAPNAQQTTSKYY